MSACSWFRQGSWKIKCIVHATSYLVIAPPPWVYCLEVEIIRPLRPVLRNKHRQGACLRKNSETHKRKHPRHAIPTPMMSWSTKPLHTNVVNAELRCRGCARRISSPLAADDTCAITEKGKRCKHDPPSQLVTEWGWPSAEPRASSVTQRPHSVIVVPMCRHRKFAVTICQIVLSRLSAHTKLQPRGGRLILSRGGYR